MTEEKKMPPLVAVAIGAVALLACGGMITAGVAMLRQPEKTTPADALARRVEAIHGMPMTAPDCGTVFKGEQPAIVVVLGQSNAGNHANRADPARAPLPMIPVLHEGGCGLSNAPLPGGTGDGGSLWPAVHQALGGRWQGHPIVWTVIAVEGTSIDDWTRGDSPLRRYWQTQVDRIKGTHWPVAAVLWQQGEADARDRTAMAEYRDALAGLRTDMGMRGLQAPWWLAKSTYCPPHDGGQVREAVRELLAIPQSGFFPGADTDSLSLPLRNGCHFTADGVTRAAALWADALREEAGKPASTASTAAGTGTVPGVKAP